MTTIFRYRGVRLKIRPVQIWEADLPKAPLVAADPQAVKEILARDTMRKVFMLALREMKDLPKAERIKYQGKKQGQSHF